MATFAGYNGSLSWVGVNAAEDTNVFNWSVNEAVDELDCTDFSSTGKRAYIVSLYNLSGSFSQYLDGTTGLGDLPLAASQMVLTASVGVSFTVTNAFCTGRTITADVNGLPVVNYTWRSSDSAITIAPV